MKFKIITMVVLAIIASGCRSSKKVADSGNSPLCNTQWNLIAIEGEYIDSTSYMSQPCIVFFQDGSFSGNFGCNTFFGSYFLKKQKIELTYKGSTKKLCPEMKMERAMMKAIKRQLSNYDISGKTLILYEGKDEVMRFEDSGERVENEQ